MRGNASVTGRSSSLSLTPRLIAVDDAASFPLTVSTVFREQTVSTVCWRGDVGDDDQKGVDNLKAKRLPRSLFSLHSQERGPAMAKRGHIRLIALKLEPSDGLSLRAFRAIDNGELNHLTLFQRLVAVRLDGRVMNKNIRVARLLNKPIALGVAEPLDLALC